MGIPIYLAHGPGPALRERKRLVPETRKTYENTFQEPPMEVQNHLYLHSTSQVTTCDLLETCKSCRARQTMVIRTRDPMPST